MDGIDEFDSPVFKLLSHNDSGAAVGHQGGVLIPLELDAYFPQLSARVTPAGPSVDESIRAQLYIAQRHVGTVETRYQYQTWGAKRTPERRITGNLTAMRAGSVEHDALLIERNLVDRKLYRLTLIKNGTPEYFAIKKTVGVARWGVLDSSRPPVAEVELEDAENAQIAHELAPLVLFDNNAALTETRSKRVARSRTFQKLTTNYYENRCAVCGEGFVARDGLIEVEAAHIVPRGRLGADDARNGIALCRKHHWAFDNGLWAVGPDRNIVVFSASLRLGTNSQLSALAGRPPQLPTVTAMSPDAAAYAWHQENVFSK